MKYEVTVPRVSNKFEKRLLTAWSLDNKIIVKKEITRGTAGLEFEFPDEYSYLYSAGTNENKFNVAVQIFDKNGEVIACHKLVPMKMDESSGSKQALADLVENLSK